MLTPEENALITRVGPATPMGNLMRQYWLPAMVSSELQPDGDPVRVMLLGEKLIGFRDSRGQVGLVANSCPHRGASLFFGRNEEAGLRCVYHGWKFDTTGACIDMPNEPAESDFKQKVRAEAYPCQERGGLVWAYLGARAVPPPMPDLAATMQPNGFMDIRVNLLECNWLQVMEGSMDETHGAFLHGGSLKPEERTGWARYALQDRTVRSYVLDTPGGVTYAARRDAEPGFYLWHILQFMFPCFTMATRVLGETNRFVCRVPMDDDHTMQIFVDCLASQAELDAEGQRLTDRGPNYGLPLSSHADLMGNLPPGTGWHDRFRRAANHANDYQIDRVVQRRNQGGDGYTGITGVAAQDGAVTSSMGPIYDRTREHLGSSDLMIARVRRRLINATRALTELGTTPPGVDDPEVYGVRAGDVMLAEDVDWEAGTSALRKAFVTARGGGALVGQSESAAGYVS